MFCRINYVSKSITGMITYYKEYIKYFRSNCSFPRREGLLEEYLHRKFLKHHYRVAFMTFGTIRLRVYERA